MSAKQFLMGAALGAMSCFALSSGAHAQETESPAATSEGWLSVCKAWDEWDKAAPPYQIFANTYYVGTCGISAILITGDDGHVLIDTGTRQGAEVVARNIQALGFALQDVNVILHSHEHFDHVGGFAWMKQQTGARIVASPEAALVLRSGELSQDDPQHGMHPPMEPVEAESVRIEDYALEGGSFILAPLATPGHTPGALSWGWKSCDGAICVNFVYADSLSAISGDAYKFGDHPEYVSDYRDGLIRVANAPCNVLLTPHPSASKMVERMAGETGLLDADACRAYANTISQRLDKRLADEAKTAAE